MKKHSKKAAQNQEYEGYWKLTVEYSDINGSKFKNTLNLIIRYIDSHPELKNLDTDSNEFSAKYEELQDAVYSVYPKADKASTRKSINQMVKLGFVKPFLQGYHPLTKKFLSAPNDERRTLVFSEIFYKSANFQSAVTTDDSEVKPINFFLMTLMYHPKQRLNREEIIALMTTNIKDYTRGYLTIEELNSCVKYSKAIDFEDRKYNQINYLLKFLQYVPGISVSPDKNCVFYTEDATIQLRGEVSLKRDPTLFRIMRENIKQESIEKYGKVVCYLTKQELKGLVVSHIVGSAEALRNMDIETAYDYENALLLEPNSDAYFDKHDLTFAEEGTPVYGNDVSEDFIKGKQGMKLDDFILTEKRLGYLVEHRNKFNSKNNIPQ
ncbi:hypothetical protein QM847_06520 [Streptococcus timonensis]|uniref:HNH endonuclease n=1 Tax=Streptococcus timonensis TaxID=1852387 RepID=UPI0039C148F8